MWLSGAPEFAGVWAIAPFVMVGEVDSELDNASDELWCETVKKGETLGGGRIGSSAWLSRPGRISGRSVAAYKQVVESQSTFETRGYA